MARWGSLAALLIAAGWLRAAAGENVDFAREIRPILANYCYDCHGPDETRRRVGLRLDTPAGWSAPLESGKTLVAQGKRGQSELWRRINAGAEDRMPAAESGKRLSPEQIETIGQWIDAGGEYAPHWAYVRPQRGRPGSGSLHPVDGYVLERLSREGWKPSPPAAKEAQLRRVTLDLTGLPPTVAEIDAFLADASPDAYERVVDRLLASPRFGERMAQDWLDLARYADTHGYHSDSHRDMWRYRAWVIEAINHNMPFDQFSIEQLAGDLLPNATLSQRIATGLHRNNMVNFENGAIPEEYRTEYVIDRVVTTGTVWLGQTWLCARCHDHKYDPISQEDFYRLAAYFNSIAENGLDGRAGNAVPYIPAPTDEQQQSLDGLQRNIDGLAAAMERRSAACNADFLAWQRNTASTEGKRAPPADAVAHFPLDEASHVTIHGNETFVGGKFGQAMLFDGDTHAVLGDMLPLERHQPFTLSLWMFATSEEKGTLLARVDDAFTSRGFSLVWENRRLVARLRNEATTNESVVSTTRELPLRKWLHIAVTYDGRSKADGVRILVDGEAADCETLVDNLSGSIATRRPWQLGLRDKDDPWRGMLDEVRMYSRDLNVAEIALLAGGDPLAEILAKPPPHRTEQEDQQLRRYYLEHHDPAYGMLLEQRSAAEREKEQLARSIPTAMVMQELETPRDTFVLERGLYNRPKQKVAAAVPEQFLKPAEGPSNRLGLAKWLVDRRNPLTARVAVNRYWSHFFGRGLVATPEDFGVRGSPPSHPELLDYLAVEFVESEWDVKRLVRLIITSHTYRQSGRTTADMKRRDPENVLLARGPRVRLPAEIIRDSALAAGGLLCERVGGPSVHPYQPTDLWKDLAYDATTFSAQTFHPSRGADLYRRSLYTFWKRTAPHPLLTAFDAPSRETCTVERPRTTSPMQALAMLNDQTLLEAARSLAGEMLRQPGLSTADRIDLAFRTVLSRRPTATERARLARLLDEQLAAYGADLDSARDLLETTTGGERTAEWAAWTTVVCVMFNLDEFFVH